LQDIYKLGPFPTLGAARIWLLRRKRDYPPRYTKVRGMRGVGPKGGGPRYRRVLTASEVRRIRSERVVDFYKDIPNAKKKATADRR
jgi:hypothetical protein